MTEPRWMPIARSYMGVRETPGAQTTPIIRRWLVRLRAWWTDDETPWCGVFAGAVMREAGIDPPLAYYRARAWLQWGRYLDAPEFGCVAIFERGAAGHVGFVAGTDWAGNLMVLGGNQADRVSIMPYSRARVLGYRWPLLMPMPSVQLPIIPHRVHKFDANDA